MIDSIVFPLQAGSLSQFQINVNPIHGIIFIFGVAVIVGVFIFLNKSKRVANSTVFQSGAIKKPSLKPAELKKITQIAHKYSLDGNEARFLQEAFQNADIDIINAFNDKNSIDKSFSQTFRSLNKEDNSSGNVAKLFAVRNKIEYFLSSDDAEYDDDKHIQRRYKRVKANITAALYTVRVTIVKKGFKNEKKLTAEKTAAPGKIIDISAGGCAISTQANIRSGVFLKIEFKISRSGSAVLAQVLRINKEASGAVLHLRFLKTPLKSLNAINSLVYNYKEY